MRADRPIDVRTCWLCQTGRSAILAIPGVDGPGALSSNRQASFICWRHETNRNGTMQGKLILVVDDEAPIREMLRFALTRADYRVAEAADAQAARLRIADARPDLKIGRASCRERVCQNV